MFTSIYGYMLDFACGRCRAKKKKAEMTSHPVRNNLTARRIADTLKVRKIKN